VATLVSACSDATPGSSLDSYLPSTPGNGLPGAVVTQQALDQSAAGQATPLAAATVQGYLAATHFQGGYARIWGVSPTFVTSLVFQFTTTSDATAFLTDMRRGIGGGNNTFVTDHPAIPGSFVFVLDGTSAAGGPAPQFCNGVWLSRAQRAFEALVCGASAQWASQAEALAGSEYALAPASR
jgi:hypothetical protein